MKNNSTLPILSICIPTYNRAALLDKLLGQIFSFELTVKSKIEVCISDNNSSDETPEIILGWASRMRIMSMRQRSNIGGSRNFQAVASISSAPWVLLMGDDDLFSKEGLVTLLELLESIQSNTWILADIANQDGTSLLQKFHGGIWSKSEFKRKILIDSLLDSIGFMSMHVIPRKSINRFLGLSIEDIYGWPHLALLFIEFPSTDIYFHRQNIVKRGGDGDEVTQTWRANDWLCLMMQKTKLCCYSDVAEKKFSTSIALREYMRWAYVRQTFHAMLCFENRRGLFEQGSKYIELTPMYSMAKLLLKVYILFLLLMPIKLISIFRKLNNPSAIELNKENASPISTDGMDRGL